MPWQTSWTQAMTDVGAMRRTFTDVTLRTRLTATIGGEQLRLELSNRFGSDPVVLGHIAVTVGGRTADLTIDGSTSGTIAAGGTIRTDAAALPVQRGDVLTIDVFLPEPTAYTTANVMGSPFQASGPGDHAGTAEFPDIGDLTLSTPDGQTVVLSAPMIRGVEVEGTPAQAVLVCLGDSIAVMGWPAIAAGLLPDAPAVAVLNRGLAGNRLRFDPMPQFAAFGRSGLSRFDEDVLGTVGATHVVLALGTNDLGHPGAAEPLEQLPSAAELIDAYREVVSRAEAAGLQVVIATISPFMPAPGYDEGREAIRIEVNDWVRADAPAFVDFDAALRSPDDPSRLLEEFDSGDHLHPNGAGQRRLGQAMADAITAGLHRR